MQELLDYLHFNIATSAQISKALNLNAMAVSRKLRKLGAQIVKIPNGRSPLYALRKNAFGIDGDIHIWEIDEFGKPTCITTLTPLTTGGFFIENQDLLPKAFLGLNANGLYEDLPYFLWDMAPQGFLGKRIAGILHSLDASFPSNPDNWQTEHIGRYLLTNSENAMGNLQFGNNTNLKLRPNLVKTSRQHYPEIANSIIDSEVNISSAGGEHQKFTVYCAQEQAHVLVKFSPKGNSDVAIRWRDILLTEYYANKILNTTGFITAAQSNIIENGDRLFLESVRFDRSGEYGRRSMISLKAIAMEFSNIANNWLDISQNLLEQKLISSQDEFNMQVLWHFGKLIHNTDMHPGNLSFAIKGEGFSLLPVYDMCSMGFAPQGNAEVRQFNFNYPNLTNSNNEILRLAIDIAHNFWHEIYQDDRISVEFRIFIKGLLQNQVLQ
jgi:hypothetical protein